MITLAARPGRRSSRLVRLAVAAIRAVSSTPPSTRHTGFEQPGRERPTSSGGRGGADADADDLDHPAGQLARAQRPEVTSESFGLARSVKVVIRSHQRSSGAGDGHGQTPAARWVEQPVYPHTRQQGDDRDRTLRECHVLRRRSWFASSATPAPSTQSHRWLAAAATTAAVTPEAAQAKSRRPTYRTGRSGSGASALARAP